MKLTVLTVLLSFYAELDVVVVLYPLRPVVHMFTLDIRLHTHTHTQRPAVSEAAHLHVTFKPQEQEVRERPYHHLSSEQLRDGSLNTSAFHLVLHVVQELQQTTRQHVYRYYYAACSFTEQSLTTLHSS